MIEFFRSLQGIVVIGAASLVACWAWVASIKSKAVTEERARVEAQGAVVNAKAKAASAKAKSQSDKEIVRYYRD